MHLQCKQHTSHSCGDDQDVYGTARGPGGHKDKPEKKQQKGTILLNNYIYIYMYMYHYACRICEKASGTSAVPEYYL